MGEAAACHICSEFPSQRELVLPCTAHFKNDVGKGAEAESGPAGHHASVPVTWMRDGLAPLEQIFHIQTAT